MKLLRKPTGTQGNILSLSPADAGWQYVGFQLYQLSCDDQVTEETENREAILILIEGKAVLQVDHQHFGECGDRMSVFERTKPHCLYVSAQQRWKAQATCHCVLAVGYAPSVRQRPAAMIGPEGVTYMERGQGSNTRYIHAIAMEERDVADHLLITEVFTPSGHWSSYPPHRHDVDRYPEVTYLEETYYHRLNPSQGFAFQRVFTDDGTIDETLCIHDGDLVLVPRGYHPFGVPYGYESYYLNVMAGPLRKWRFQNHPDHDWIFKRDL